MPFPYGGKATYSDLAGKFGWPTVIISPLLLPITFVLTNVFCYPFFFPRKWNYTSKQHAWYLEDGVEVWRQKMYYNKKCEVGSFAGWQCYVDKEGGKFYESIWGLMNCLDADIYDDYLVFKPNMFSWVIGIIYCEMPKDKKGHRIRFYFGNGGINYYNPFAWGSIMFCIAAISLMNVRGLPKFKAKYPMRNEAENFPADEDPADLREDGSMAYSDPDKNSDTYGSIS
jgi:hypothetical protein